MIKVKKKLRGRPRRSESGVDLRAIGKRMRQLRGKVPQEDFARLLGISQPQLSKYELGQSAPPLGVLTRLATESGKSLDWIVRGEG